MMVLWTALLAASAGELELIDGLKAELTRSVAELRLTGGEPIYHLRYKVWLVDELEVVASRGAVLSERSRPVGWLGVEVRVGTPEWDNTGFGGWEDGFRAGGLPVDLDVVASRREAWRQTDQAYKDAVEQLSRKKAQVSRPDDHPGDYYMGGKVVVGPPPPGSAIDPSLRATALAASVALDRAELELAEVHVWQGQGAAWALDSEGSQVVQRNDATVMRAVARVRLPDGSDLTDDLLWMVVDRQALPPTAQIEREVKAMADRLVALADVPAVTEEYVGPVMFVGEAAADLYRWQLFGQLVGTPPEVPFESFFGDIGDADGGARMGRRVLPVGWRVQDDPQAIPSHPGAYLFDGEGTPAEPVKLVEDGIVRSLWMSRTPRKGIASSNGHGRATIYDRAVGEPALVEVEAKRALPMPAFTRAALKAASDYGHDSVLVVKRLAEPAIEQRARPWSWEAPESGLPRPVEVERWYADGRREPVRGLVFSSVQRWVLRDIIAAGPSVATDALDATRDEDMWLGPTDGTPVRITAPQVVVGEMELVPALGDPDQIRLIPPPLVGAPPG